MEFGNFAAKIEGEAGTLRLIEDAAGSISNNAALQI